MNTMLWIVMLVKRVFIWKKYNRFPIPIAEIQQNSACEQFDEWK